MRLVIGSRGSQLALTQTNMIADLLRARQVGLEVAVQIIRTHGDVATGPLRSFGGQGVFTKELEAALLAGEIDLAVHSLKDLPTDSPEGLVVVASPPREDIRDVLVSRFPGGLVGLPPQARLGTGSRRRRAQLLALRPDLQPGEIRGNLDTRIAKVTGGEFDAIVLAAAGLHRLGWRDRISAYLEPDQVLPAVGQGALGLQMRADSPWRSLVAELGDADTLAAVAAERSLLRALGGGCHAPIAAWGRIQDQALHLDALVGASDGTRLLRAAVTGPPAAADELGVEAGRQLMDMGARELLAAAEPTQ